MTWAGFLTHYRAGLAALGAVSGHAIILAFILLSRPSHMPRAQPAIPVTLVDLEPMADREDAQPLPSEPEPEFIPLGDDTTAPLPTLKQSQSPPVSEPMPKTVPFTSLGRVQDPNETVVPQPPSGASGQSGPYGLSSDAAKGLRLAIRRSGCRKLVRESGPECPVDDLFARRDALADLRAAQALEPLTIGPPAPQNYAEAFLARNSDMPPKMLSGEDNSSFIDPMAPGAYNAARIRRGEAPIWSRDIQEGLERARQSRR